jgi:hypothetical protein
MEQVNVVVAASFDKKAIPIDLERIIAISPRIKVVDASEFLAQEQRGDLSSKGEFDTILNNADVMGADDRSRG